MTWDKNSPLILEGYKDTSDPVQLSDREVDYLRNKLPEQVGRSVSPVTLYRDVGGTVLEQRGVAGAISLPTGRLLQLESNFGTRNFIYMWLYADDVTQRYIGELPIPTEAETADANVIDALGRMFERELSKLLRAGPRARYKERTFTTSHPSGRIDMQKQLRRKPPQLDVVCQERSRTYDTILNRGICRAAELLTDLVSNEDTRSHIERHVATFRDYISTTEVSVAEFDTLEISRLEKDYARILPMAKQLLRNSYFGNVSTDADTSTCTMFVQMSQIFEKTVEQAYEVAAQEFGLRIETQHHIDGFLTGGRFNMYPDIVVFNGSDPVAIIDAKFKSLGSKPENKQLYQISTYQQTLETPGMLVYPEQELKHQRYHVDDQYPLHVSRLPIDTDHDSYATFIDAIETKATESLDALLSDR